MINSTTISIYPLHNPAQLPLTLIFRSSLNISNDHQMATIAAESMSELKRSGGFELIFPVGDSAHKYFRFFDEPRPLERMVAALDTGPRRRKPNVGLVGAFA